MKRLLLISAACLSGSVMWGQATGIPQPFICTITNGLTTGFVLTATSTSACQWQSAGSATVDANATKNGGYIADTSVTANTITGTTGTTFPGAYAAGQAVWIKVANTNTGATTLNINALGAKNVTKNGAVALVGGELISGQLYFMVYDGTQFQVVTPTPLVATSAASGIVPASGGGTTNFLRADLTWAAPVGTVSNTTFTGGIISIATPTTTPAFSVSGTSGGIPYFSSASAWASSGALAANALTVGGGAGIAPTTGNGDFTYTTHTLASAAAGLVNFSAITGGSGFRVPVQAGSTDTVNGGISYDSTNNMYHGAVNSADSFFANYTVTPVNGHCTNWVVTGANYLLGDAGSVCGSGGGGGITLTSPNGTLTLGANCATSGSCTADVTHLVSTPVFNAGGTTTCNVSASSGYTCIVGNPMTGNTTLAVSGSVTGQTYTLVFNQDSAGGRVVTYPGTFNGICSPWTEANTQTQVTINFDGTNYHQIGCFSNATGSFVVGPERAAITATSASQGAFSFASGSHTAEYYANNSANRHIMARTAGTTDQLSYGDVINAVGKAAANTTVALPTTAVGSNSCDSTATTATATGLATTNGIVATPNVDPTGISGYGPGQLYIWVYPTANTANVKRCNPTGNAITPAAMTLNLVFPQ